MPGHAVVSRSVKWSTPADVKDQVRRIWSRGVILAEMVRKSGFFPYRLLLKRPTSGEFVSRLGEVRSWGLALRDMAHVRVTTRELKHPLLGVHTVPHHVWVDSAEDAVALIGKGDQADLFRRVVALTQRQQPRLLPWLSRRPLRALRVAERWQSLLDATAWLQVHPRPGVYLRQVEVLGVDCRFLEDHRVVLAELLDAALPPGSIDAAAQGLAGFARRYGFLDKPARIRLRMLDRERNLLAGTNDQDVTLDAKTFASLETGVKTAVITENEINFLALPPLKDSVAILAAGRDFGPLGQAEWLLRCHVHHWGDIDTRGFAGLDALRCRFEHAQSLLMDRETLLAFRAMWTKEKLPVRRDLAHLTAPEQALYDDLRNNRLGTNLRLGQERIGFAWVRTALAELERRCAA